MGKWNVYERHPRNEDDLSDDDSDEDISINSSGSDDVSESDSDSEPQQSSSGMHPAQNDAVTEEQEEEENELVRAIRREREKVREHPPDIECEDFIVRISFHPRENILAAALVTGDVCLYKYANESNELLNSCELHTRGCRDVQFTEDGTTMISCSKDKSIVITDVSTGNMKKFYDNTHEDPPYSLLVVDENLFVTGDEGGTVKMWDVRRNDPIFSLREMDSDVTKMITNEDKRLLVCSSGDGCITTINLLSRKLHLQSEYYEAELTCMGLVRSDTKLVVGSSKGKLYIFNWGEFGHHSDEFPGPKSYTSDLIAVTDNIIIRADDDGMVRATYLFPHRHLGIVGQHQYAVDSLDISYDGNFLASSDVNQTIKFWNIKYFEDVQVDEKKKANKHDQKHNLPSSKYKNASDFFAEMA